MPACNSIHAWARLDPDRWSGQPARVVWVGNASLRTLQAGTAQCTRASKLLLLFKPSTSVPSPSPTPQLLNGIIQRACAAGNPAAAQSAFNRLCRARLASTAATFAPLLAALQRQHPADEVAELAVGLADQADEACGTPGLGMRVGAARAALAGRVLESAAGSLGA